MNASLSLCFSARPASVAVRVDEQIADSQFPANACVEQVIPEMQSCLERLKTPLSAIEACITTEGPGSFTGMRIAFATLKAIAISRNIPIWTLDSLEAMALGWLSESPSSKHKEVRVIHQVASKRYAFAHFQILGDLELRPIDRGVCDQDIPLKPGAVNLVSEEISPQEGIHFVLKAKHLPSILEKAKTKKQHTSIENWIALSPNYFGERGFRCHSPIGPKRYGS